MSKIWLLVDRQAGPCMGGGAWVMHGVGGGWGVVVVEFHLYVQNGRKKRRKSNIGD